MSKRWPLPHRIACLSAVLCLASTTVAGAALAECLTPQAQSAFDQRWRDDPRPSMTQMLADIWDDPRPTVIQTAADIHTWKTLTLGTYRELPALRLALEQAGCGVGDDVDAMLAGHAFPLAPDPREIDLVVLSVAQLGFPSEASRAAIFARAEELGLQLCPPEVGPLLRLHYPEQPVGDFLRIAMDPVRMANGELDDMLVGNGGAGQFLVAASVRPDQTLPWNVLLVFARKSSDASITARH